MPATTARSPGRPMPRCSSRIRTTRCEWPTRAVRDGAPMDTYKARDLMRQIADATWVCGDPGMQFDTTVNDWHTCPNTARINASNPCSEYMFLDDSACNLASINLMKFVRDDGELDVESFKAACRTLITAQEILVDNSSYPTKAIEKNSHAFRPLGLGYANLGALLMSRGLPYDSDAGRDYAAAITAIMHGAAFAQSAKVARDHGGPFAGYEKNREPFLRVMRKHRAALRDIDKTHVPKDLMEAAKTVWDEVIEMGEQHGFRNAQATVLAPTGTIGFMMDCDTTGVEPDIALVKYKKMVGATQPFLSGAISKTVNVPKEATVEEIEQAYVDSWRLGAKAVSIYRDGSKRTQPLNTSRDKEKVAAAAEAGPRRRRLPDERSAITHKFDIAGHEGYITVGLYEDGMPGEIFIVMAKEGSTISGFADAFAQAISYALQYGVPLQDLVDKFSHVRFEPSGMTRNPDVRFAKSIVDYIFRWMASKFLSPEAQYVAGVNNRDEVAEGGVVCGDSESGRRPAVLDVRLDHGAQWGLLQVLELRYYLRLRLTAQPSGRRRRRRSEEHEERPRPANARSAGAAHR